MNNQNQNQNQTQPTRTEFLTVEQTANLLQVSKSTVYLWVSKKIIPFTRKGKQLRFRRAEVEAWSL